jgi:hypothetical protein
MVFESIVADLLNRFLGDYVENLDHSQLKIGIWGGKRIVSVVFSWYCCKSGMAYYVWKVKSNKSLPIADLLGDAYCL